MKTCRSAVPVLGMALTAAVVLGQIRPTFEVASIHAVPPQVSGVNVGLRIEGSQVRFTYLSLRESVARAYRLKAWQIIGPAWLNEDRFDITAILPPGASASQIPEMLQTLLVQRFQLRLHRASRDFPVYSLEVARGGIKLQELPADPN